MEMLRAEQWQFTGPHKVAAVAGVGGVLLGFHEQSRSQHGHSRVKTLRQILSSKRADLSAVRPSLLFTVFL